MDLNNDYEVSRDVDEKNIYMSNDIEYDYDG